MFKDNQIKAFAFTLAEIVIVIGIIGIIAEFTIPQIYSGIQNSINLTKFKSMYSKLNNAHRIMTSQDDPSWSADYRFNNDTFANGILKYFKVKKTCSTAATGNCWPSESYYINGSSAGGGPTSAYVLEDDTFIYFVVAGNVCNYPDVFSCSSDHSVMEVIGIDVNGFKPPNMWGGDQFFFLGTVDKFNPGYTIGGGRECGYNIIMGNSLYSPIAPGGRTYNLVRANGKIYNKCGY